MFKNIFLIHLCPNLIVADRSKALLPSPPYFQQVDFSLKGDFKEGIVHIWYKLHDWSKQRMFRSEGSSRRSLICVFSVCLSPFNWTLGVHGLTCAENENSVSADSDNVTKRQGSDQTPRRVPGVWSEPDIWSIYKPGFPKIRWLHKKRNINSKQYVFRSYAE